MKDAWHEVRELLALAVSGVLGREKRMDVLDRVMCGLGLAMVALTTFVVIGWPVARLIMWLA